MKKTMVLLLSGSILLAACHKNNEKTASDKVQGKWTFVSEIENSNDTGQPQMDTLTGGPSDYFDFRNDGKVYRKLYSYMDTLPYTVLSDRYILFNGDSTEIKTLTDSSFVLYDKLVYGQYWDEVTVTLKK